MKYLVLVFVRLKRYYSTNKLIFVLFILGSIISGITFIYFYGNSLSYKVHSTKDNIQYQTYHMKFMDQIDYNKAISGFNNNDFNSYNIKDVSLEGELSNSDISGDNVMVNSSIHNYLIQASLKNSKRQIEEHESDVG